MFFNRTQKQGLPLLNPNAKPFDPEALIKRRDRLHEQRIKLRDQHSMVIEDLAPGQEVLTFISGIKLKFSSCDVFQLFLLKLCIVSALNCLSLGQFVMKW